MKLKFILLQLSTIHLSTWNNFLHSIIRLINIRMLMIFIQLNINCIPPILLHQLIHRPHSSQPTINQYPNLISNNLSLLHIMSRQNNTSLINLHILLQCLPHIFPRHRINTSGGLIKINQLRSPKHSQTNT